MTEIPDDIIDAARALNIQLHGATELGQKTQWIAAALLAECEAATLKERERCALAVERIAHQGLHESMWRRKFLNMAEIIRKGITL